MSERGINFAINQIRAALGDEADDPRFIETIPRRGYRFIAQLEGDEQGVAGASSSVTPISSGHPEVQVDRLPAHVFSTGRILIGCVLLFIAIGTLLFFSGVWRERAASAPANTAMNVRTFPLTTLQGSIWSPGLTFSPDARQIAFLWANPSVRQTDIYVQLIGGDRPFQVTHSQTRDGGLGAHIDWSPDGRLIVFERCADENRGALYTISPLGGAEHKIADLACNLGAVWTPDGQSLVFSDTCSAGGSLGIMLLTLATGWKRCLVASDSNTVDLLFPRVSPDGRTVAYTRQSTINVADTYVVSIKGGTPLRLTFEGKFSCVPEWSKDGRYIILGSDRGNIGGYRLWKLPAKGGAIEPETIYPHYGPLSRNGQRLAYVENGGGEHEGIWRAQLSSPGGNVLSQKKIFDSKTGDQAPQLSPDGKHIAFMSGISGTGNTWTTDADGSNAMQLTSFSGELNGTPRWSPDGKWIVFDRRPADHAQIYVIDAEGRNMRAITDGAYDNNVPTWSRDGRSIYFSSNRTGQWQMWKHDLGTGVEAQITQHGGFSAFESYDGRYLYYVKPRTPGIWRVATGGGEEQRATDQPADWGAWDVTETGLYFFDPDAKPRPRFAFYDFKTHLITNVFEPEAELTTESPVLSASRNGRIVFYSQRDPTSTIKIVENFQ